jgi:uncharacterized protein (TIGR00299 family) protein
MTHAHDDQHHHGHHHHVHTEPTKLDAVAAQGKVLFLDAFSGVSGDMFVSSLLDLGVPLSVVESAVQTLPIEGYRLELGVRVRSGIGAASFDVHVNGPQPERTFREIASMLERSALNDSVGKLAVRIFSRLAHAEARVHHTAPDDVHFHEVGAVDAIVDIVAAAAMVTWLAPSEILCTPLPMGRGFVRARHGVLPLPAPATLHCLEGVPVYGVDVEGELVTPTGAAIVSTLASGFAQWPSMVVEHIGFGSGANEWGDRPNLLRSVLGSRNREIKSSDDVTACAVLETNVDDMTGELAGHVIRLLVGAGALDVWVTPTTTKKGRPGMVLSVLAEVDRRDALEQMILRETTSLGVRAYTVTRNTRPRVTEQVDTPYGAIPVKVSGGGSGSEQAKPEFDACAQAAERHGVPVREVAASAITAYRCR